MASKGQALIDGKGNERVISAMAENKVFLRKVREDDCKLLWKWANEKETRKWSFSSQPISCRDHQKWFAGKFKDPSCFHFIATDIFGNAVGQIRFDVVDDIAETHITIERDMRGSGTGSRLLKVAVDELRDLALIKCVRGHVLPENIASIRAFKNAGFQKKGTVLHHGMRCIRFDIRLISKKDKQGIVDVRDDEN